MKRGLIADTNELRADVDLVVSATHAAFEDVTSRFAADFVDVLFRRTQDSGLRTQDFVFPPAYLLQLS